MNIEWPIKLTTFVFELHSKILLNKTKVFFQVKAPSLVSHYFYHPVTFHDMPTPGTDRLTPAWERIHFGDVDFWWQKSFEGSSSCKWSDPFDYQRHIVRLVDHLTRDFWGMVKSWSCKSLFFPTQYTFIPHIQVLFNVNNIIYIM